MSTNNSAPAPSIVELTAADVLGPGVVACPNPKMSLWSNHPKVYLDVGIAGEVKCPYCSTLYRMKPGEAVGGHH